jgi:glutamate-5-semialdehyde dehydrogenase
MNESEVRERAVLAREAVARFRTDGLDKRSAFYGHLARLLEEKRDDIQKANALDLEEARSAGLSSSMLDRLTLTDQRIDDLIQSVREIDAFPDSLGVHEGRRLENGLILDKVQVGIGVVGFIYESRPNVTIDAVALCLKSGNAVLLKGGKEAVHSNLILESLCRMALLEADLPDGLVCLLDCTDRAVVGYLCELDGLVDLVIPRGGPGLIKAVVEASKVPVIKHDAGNCHIFVDETADVERAVAIVDNAKTQRPGVCNAVESLVVAEGVAGRFLPQLKDVLDLKGVELRCCPQSLKVLNGATPAVEEDWGTEYLDLILSVKMVPDFSEAVQHINKFSSGHTEAILTADLKRARAFEEQIDSAVVLVNASTRFSDGGQFGLGAEIGISTNRLHARGPMGAASLTTYKYVVRGEGQVRS